MYRNSNMIWDSERNWNFFLCFGLFWFWSSKKKISGSIIYACVSMIPNFKFETILTHPKKAIIKYFYPGISCTLERLRCKQRIALWVVALDWTGHVYFGRSNLCIIVVWLCLGIKIFQKTIKTQTISSKKYYF